MQNKVEHALLTPAFPLPANSTFARPSGLYGMTKRFRIPRKLVPYLPEVDEELGYIIQNFRIFCVPVIKSDSERSFCSIENFT